MKKSATFIVALMLAGMTPHALPSSSHDSGLRADNGSLQRVIRIAPETASVSACRKHTVKSVGGQTGKNLAWRFDTPRMENFPLGGIDPAGCPGDRTVTAYVRDVSLPAAMLLLYLVSTRSSLD